MRFSKTTDTRSLRLLRASLGRLSPANKRVVVMAVVMVGCFGMRSLILRQLTPTHASAQHPTPLRDVPALSETAQPAASLTPDLSDAERISRVLALAASLEGTPYLAAGDTPKGFDCSGFVYHVFREALGMKLPRSSRGMTVVGQAVPKTEAQMGDLLFFTGSTLSRETIGHVGLVVEASEGRLMMIHTSSSRGVVTENVYAMPYYQARFRQVRRPDY
jgi:cell wall-associated NlpC family hydrolase